MFPHPCGDAFADAVNNKGVDPKTVVPDDYVVVHGGIAPVPPAGTEYSGATGPDLAAAACAVPHNKIRVTTAGAIRAGGGTVEWELEISRNGAINRQHVNIVEAGPTTFSDPQANPVPPARRVH
jgi:hypothetical protein